MKSKTCPDCSAVFSFEGRSRKRCPACHLKIRSAIAVRSRVAQAAQRQREAEEYAGLGELLKPITVRTLAQVGGILGLTTERVRQIERQALWKIKHRMLEAIRIEQLRKGLPVEEII